MFVKTIPHKQVCSNSDVISKRFSFLPEILNVKRSQLRPFLFVNKFDGVLSELMARLISIYFMGFCFYVIIPTLNKIKKIQGAAITILIMEVLAIVGFLFYDGNMNKKFILDVITTIVAFIGSVYFIMNPEDISKN